MDNTNLYNLKNFLWVVYPPGSAGDWLSYLISRHYHDSGIDLLPSDPIGKINFVGSDTKALNQFKPELSSVEDENLEKFKNQLNKIIINGYYSLNRNIQIEDVSQLILSNHFFEDMYINDMLNTTSWKFIRILPYTPLEKEFVFKSIVYKIFKQNQSKLPWPGDNVDLFWQYIGEQGNINKNERLLELSVSDIILESRWEETYSKIKIFLDIEIDLISKNSLQYYYNLQPPHIQESLDKLKNVS